MVGGIDLTRYEAPEKPADDSEIETWRKSLRQAYMSSSYLSGRLTNLSLLEEFGKNAWLISNSQLEDILRDLGKELSQQKEAVENINKSRKAAQEESRAELVGLEEAWKQGVGKTIEVQLATDGVRREILQRRRNNH
jgi:pre-mRNA-splicing factor SPF27